MCVAPNCVLWNLAPVGLYNCLFWWPWCSCYRMNECYICMWIQLKSEAIITSYIATITNNIAHLLFFESHQYVHICKYILMKSLFLAKHMCILLTLTMQRMYAAAGALRDICHSHFVSGNIPSSFNIFISLTLGNRNAWNGFFSLSNLQTIVK